MERFISAVGRWQNNSSFPDPKLQGHVGKDSSTPEGGGERDFMVSDRAWKKREG